jgi:putative addiction module component (TIGR02574 family)
MSRSLKQLQAEALELSSVERRALIEVLSASLDGDGDDESPEEIENAWADEIRTRLEEYRAGRVQTVPADEVFARLRREFG